MNNCARVVRPEGLSLGNGPGFSAGHVQIVGVNDIVFVTEGPTRADGLWWWKMTTRSGVVGWGINDHIAPYTGACFGSVAPAASLTAIPPVALPGGPAVAAATSSGSQGQLPTSGAGDTGLIFAGALVLVLLTVSLIRRRTQRTI